MIILYSFILRNETLTNKLNYNSYILQNIYIRVNEKNSCNNTLYTDLNCFMNFQTYAYSMQTYTLEKRDNIFSPEKKDGKKVFFKKTKNMIYYI